MFLVNEIKTRGFIVILTIPNVFCKVFEDNSGALELARLPKLRPQTKHINTCYHHFREHVHLGLIKIYPVGTKDQIADILTKPCHKMISSVIERQCAELDRLDLLSTQSIAGRECAISIAQCT